MRYFLLHLILLLLLALFCGQAKASPCDDLGECWVAAENYCDQIQGTWATHAIIEMGSKECTMCCYDEFWGEVCEYMFCEPQLPLIEDTDAASELAEADQRTKLESAVRSRATLMGWQEQIAGECSEPDACVFERVPFVNSSACESKDSCNRAARDHDLCKDDGGIDEAKTELGTASCWFRCKSGKLAFILCNKTQATGRELLGKRRSHTRSR